MNHMAKRQMDHMNHMAKEITWRKKSHGERNHMEKEITWRKKSHEERNHMAKEITWRKKSHGERNHMAKEITWRKKSHEKTDGKREKNSEASDGNSSCSSGGCFQAILLAIVDCGQIAGGGTARIARGQVGHCVPLHLTDCHDQHAKDEALQVRVKSHLSCRSESSNKSLV